MSAHSLYEWRKKYAAPVEKIDEQVEEIRRLISPELRATDDALQEFIEALQDRVSPCSTLMMSQALLGMLRLMAPTHDWTWLASVTSNLKRLATPSKNKLGHMVGAQDLYALGIELMDISRYSQLPPFKAAMMGRDGLMIALLTCTPVRISNLTMIEIGKHLVQCPNGYMLSFDPDETKNRRHYRASLPSEVAVWLDFYLEHWRPVLLSRPRMADNTRLWISKFGTPLGEPAIREQIKQRTKSKFGTHVWPHLFRAIASTGFVDYGPEMVELLPDLLGHSNVQTSHRYYVLSSGACAHDYVQKSLEQQRGAAAKRVKYLKTKEGSDRKCN